MRKFVLYTIIVLNWFIISCSSAQQKSAMQKNPYYSRTDDRKLKVSNEEWKHILPKEMYDVARLAYTEYAFTGKYWKQDIPRKK